MLDGTVCNDHCMPDNNVGNASHLIVLYGNLKLPKHLLIISR